MINEIAFTCYPVKDMIRAIAFYEKILGLKPDAPLTESSGGMWVEYSFGGGTFSLGKMDGFNPHEDGPSVAFEVDDFDATIKNLKDMNIKFKFEPMETPVCHMAMFSDTEGNPVMVHKRKA